MSVVRFIPTLSIRRGVAVSAACVALSAGVAWAHSGMAMDHMGAGPVAAICLAVLETGLLGLAAMVAAKPRPALRALRLEVVPLPSSRGAGPRLPPARAGPSLLQVFLR